jgi:hypothetical protein
MGGADVGAVAEAGGAVSKDRYYGSGVEKALFMLSRGTCYEPTCKTPVLRMTKTGTPRVNVQIAHIYPLRKGEARDDDSYPMSDRNMFKNLLLLCQTHHTEVDSELWVQYYQAEVLFTWKRQREGSLSDALGELPPLVDDEQFQDILVDAISRMRNAIIAAIDKVAGISQETLTLLKELVSESFTRPYLTEEAVASLEYSARVFDGMGDQTTMLYESARDLQGIEDHAWALHESSQDLRQMPDYAFPLLEAARDLTATLPDHAGQLAEAAADLRNLPDYVDVLSRIAQQLEAARLSEAVDRAGEIEDAARQLNAATANAPDLVHAAESLQAATQNMGFAEEPAGRWSWTAFGWGAAACFVVIAGLLALWTFAIK